MFEQTRDMVQILKNNSQIEYFFLHTEYVQRPELNWR